MWLYARSNNTTLGGRWGSRACARITRVCQLDRYLRAERQQLSQDKAQFESERMMVKNKLETDLGAVEDEKARLEKLRCAADVAVDRAGCRLVPNAAPRPLQPTTATPVHRRCDHHHHHHRLPCAATSAAASAARPPPRP
jgi:hypothetical protein